jgi:endo-1,4-beta-xylanase
MSGAGGGAGTSSGGNTGSGGNPGSTGAGGSSGGRGGAGAGGSIGTGGAQGGSTGTGGQGGLAGHGGSAGLAGAGGSMSSGGAGGAAAGSGGAGGAASVCPPATPLTGGKQYCSSSQGTADGNYAYELWSDGTGAGCMTVYGVNAAFSATWTSVGDLLARNGLQFDESKTPTQIGTISSDFAETKTGNSGLVYVGIYGWTVSPLREYYIIDDWGGTMPGGTASDGTPRTHVGTITVDGDSYDVWKHTQTNKPNITGTDQTFDQYFSVRQTARQCGHISISQHFSQWTTLGLQLGKLEEAKVLVEAQSSTGTIDFTTATVVVQ